ncbi:MAG: prepilin-type N-terminal cleavage/methylation domain-containing protein [Candidatus Wallbacteria bacterium]|nr:prepilin-type N-terminal cleavage/methylation domain-containing protein [Candidatus Wallbacteria bacterium]
MFRKAQHPNLPSRVGRPGFTIVELLITVVVIGILAAAGLAKYQNFAEASRRKTCLGQMKQIETGFQVWQNNNVAFSRRAKTAWGFSTRAGRLVGTAPDGNPLYNFSGNGGSSNLAPGPVSGAPLNADGAPSGFRNDPSGSGNANSGPLTSVIRDDNVWTCPSALKAFYGGEIQNVDDVLDIGLRPDRTISLTTNVVGLFGRYGMVFVGDGTDTTGAAFANDSLPGNWVTPRIPSTPSPAPQPPFAIAVCGCYGTYGPSSNDLPGTQPISGAGGGGPVGADNSPLNRHSSRW